jgi:putative ATP-dependent endonuclease of the OLD family
MKLEAAHVRHYRSANNVELSSIGAFNVFIGQNNSGKSTLLRAIRAFFTCLQKGNAVALNPVLGRDRIDFSSGNTAEPIEINAKFSMLAAERDILIADISAEAPQLKNAAESLDPSLWLDVCLRISPPNQHFAYIERLSLSTPANKGVVNPTVPRLLFRMDDLAAQELAGNLREGRSFANMSQDVTKFASTIDEDDFQTMRRSPEGAILQSRFGFFIRRLELQSQDSSAPFLEKLVRESTTIADFKSSAGVASAKFAEQSITAQSVPLKNQVDTFSGRQASVPKYVLKLIQTIGQIPVLYLTEHRKPVGKEEAERLLQLKVERGGDEVLTSIKEKVAALLGVKIDAFAAGTGQGNSRNAEMDVDNFLLEVNGSGIKEALRLILDVEFQQPKVLLVEEPEVHLHPALEINLMGYLKKISERCQVFISTHSTNFLDTADMQNVYLVSKSASSTGVQLLDLEEAEEKLPKELGIRLSSLFMFDRLVFVEGPSDEAVLREWADTLTVNLSQANVGFINMGGVRNFGHYAAEVILTYLTRRQVSTWFILDRDERDQEEIRKLQERLGARARVEVLQRRELENFMIVLEPLEAFIRAKQRMAANATLPEPTRESLQKSIDECANALKQLAIEKQLAKIVCLPIHPKLRSQEGTPISLKEKITKEVDAIRKQLDSMIELADKRIEEETAAVEKDWEQNKLTIVPGDILLDHVCARFGVRFKKVADGPRLASLMSASDIDQQIKNIIRDLGTI